MQTRPGRLMAEVRQDVLAALRRATVREGKALELGLTAVAGEPGNEGTLFEIRWRVSDTGHLFARAWVDGIPFSQEVILV